MKRKVQGLLTQIKEEPGGGLTLEIESGKTTHELQGLNHEALAEAVTAHQGLDKGLKKRLLALIQNHHATKNQPPN